MVSRLRKSVCIGFLFFVSAVYVFASGNPLSILIKPTSETVKAFRYLSGPTSDGLWTEVDISSPSIVLEGFDSIHDALYVQQTEDFVTWSGTYTYRYDSTKKAWNVLLEENKRALIPEHTKNPLNILIKPTSETVKAFRYQSGQNSDGLWTQADISSPSIVLEGFDSINDALYVQQSEDLATWSDSYLYTYNPTQNTWGVSLPATKKTSFVDSLEVKLYGLYPYGKSATYYSYVLGAGLKMNVALDTEKKLIGYGEATYSRGPSETDWVDSMQAIGLSVGMGYKISLGSKMQVTPELGYGVLFHIFDADFDEDGENKFEVFADQQVRLSLNLCFALGDKYELFFAPLGVLFFEDGDIGTMFGCQSGLRFNF
ncbi:hypothetical protein SpiGrapes_0049 [Sphaerochaeta pleomorpha str. Grapes]|uniref:Uncharacterized protein n=1 Tax=Sphaerochaeta pleomorpha (strain ATCC BAA-1885 / DSM 22778 / Grapes) TaxID=158190 RepID=G8QT08_SPHPG|nr:hypothetical protein [Sphaerochaeta pleomorpha]AEV27913.1 hypothetical protein SpiGrapes_0049 [Sphaerochaeta pleomorpha str. Grapes]